MSFFIDEAVKFAIDKEQEAVDFYENLAARVTRKEIKTELLKFAEIEKGHKEMLESIDVENTIFIPPKEDLKIADYVVNKSTENDMDYQDLLVIAMERELAAQRLYTDLAKISTDESVKAVFLKLAAEEGNHKNYFEKIYDDKVLTEN